MSSKSFTTLADPEIMAAIGARLRSLRGRVTQAQAAELAGLTRQTVSRAEAGDNPTLLTIIRLLRSYGRLDALEGFIPAPGVSPMALLREHRGGWSLHA